MDVISMFIGLCFGLSFGMLASVIAYIKSFERNPEQWHQTIEQFRRAKR